MQATLEARLNAQGIVLHAHVSPEEADEKEDRLFAYNLVLRGENQHGMTDVDRFLLFLNEERRVRELDERDPIYSLQVDETERRLICAM